jgi:HK97 family phage prohead protease
VTHTQTRQPFTLEGKAVDTRALDSGDLLVEGWAAVWAGLDREGENFLRGAFKKSIRAFLDGQAALVYHHQIDKGIGTVLDLQEKKEGLWFKARVDRQVESSPLFYIYNAIRKGSYRGVSLGGFFRRTFGPNGPRIHSADIAELSITPSAQHPGTRLSVAAVKALGAAPSGFDLDRELDLARLRLAAVLIGSEAQRARIDLDKARLGLL